MPQLSEEILSSQALAEARREGARAERGRGRRRLLIAWVTCAALLLGMFVVGSVAMVKAKNAAPEIISEMVAQRRAALEERVGERVDEAGGLVGEMFGFVELVWRENETMRRIQGSVGSARAQLGLLDAEVRAALSAPLTEILPLLQNGPTRARQLAESLVEIAREIRQIVPTVFYALGEAQSAFAQSPDGTSISAIIASMDALFAPFVRENDHLSAEWARLKADLHAWVGRVETDLSRARQQMQGDTLSDEFLERLGRRLF